MGPVNEEPIPGSASMVAVAAGAVVAAIAPWYAVIDFAQDHDTLGFEVVAFALSGIVAVVAGVRLRRSATLAPAVLIAFAVVCAAVGIGLIVEHAHRRTGLVLGAVGVALPLLTLIEKRWVPLFERPAPDGR